MIEPSTLRAVYSTLNVADSVPVKVPVMAVAVKVTVASDVPTLAKTAATAAEAVNAMSILPPAVVGVNVPTFTPAMATVTTPPVSAEGAVVSYMEMLCTMEPAGNVKAVAVVEPMGYVGSAPAERVAVMSAILACWLMMAAPVLSGAIVPS
jgi:hypothetical protein